LSRRAGCSEHAARNTSSPSRIRQARRTGHPILRADLDQRSRRRVRRCRSEPDPLNSSAQVPARECASAWCVLPEGDAVAPGIAVTLVAITAADAGIRGIRVVAAICTGSALALALALRLRAVLDSLDRSRHCIAQRSRDRGRCRGERGQSRGRGKDQRGERKRTRHWTSHVAIHGHCPSLLQVQRCVLDGRRSPATCLLRIATIDLVMRQKCCDGPAAMKHYSDVMIPIPRSWSIGSCGRGSQRAT
jgi:hypothetical protein